MPCFGGDDHLEYFKKMSQTFNKPLEPLEKADFLYFCSPLVPLLCEACDLIKKNKLLSNCSEELRDWFVEHDIRDKEESARDSDTMFNIYEAFYRKLQKLGKPNYKVEYYFKFK